MLPNLCLWNKRRFEDVNQITKCKRKIKIIQYESMKNKHRIEKV